MIAEIVHVCHGVECGFGRLQAARYRIRASKLTWLENIIDYDWDDYVFQVTAMEEVMAVTVMDPAEVMEEVMEDMVVTDMDPAEVMEDMVDMDMEEVMEDTAAMVTKKILTVISLHLIEFIRNISTFRIAFYSFHF